MNDIDELKLKYKHGGTQHKVIAYLSKKDATPFDIRRDMGLIHSIRDLRKVLLEMQRSKLVLSVGDDLWSITTDGLHMSVMYGGVPEPTRRKRGTGKQSEVLTREPYKPNELGFTCHRPGAYDAFLLPSRMGNRLVYPNGREVTL
jgi:hypothetical protein